MTKPGVTGRRFILWAVLCACSSESPEPVELDGGMTEADAGFDADADGGSQGSDSGPGEDSGVDDADADADAGMAVVDAGPIATAPPNILLIIADDLGLDASAQYALSEDVPNTPNLDALAARGVVFDNAWATPACTTTRATIITGEHGVHSGVSFVPAVLPSGTVSLQSYLDREPTTASYNTAIFGKWHLGGPSPPTDHPLRFGVDTYAGNLAGTIDDYARWPLTVDSLTEVSETYHTTAVTDLAIDWLEQQERAPWFLWVAYVAPHSPFHLPPANLHTQSLSGTSEDIAANTRSYFLAAIEAMDTEIGRLLEAIEPAARANTVVVFLGDNGTPRRVLDRSAFGVGHGKGTLYEGGVRVPLIVAGATVDEGGRHDETLVNTTDLFATLVELAGGPSPGYRHSHSFAHRLRSESGDARPYNYVEFESRGVTGWAVRNAQYKLIRFDGGGQELYDLSVDVAEQDDLLLTEGDFTALVDELADFAQRVRTSSPSDTSTTSAAPMKQ